MTPRALCPAEHLQFRSRSTGKERDAESGNDYFGKRYYASSMGRWMSPDRINVTEDRMMNPSSTLNKYAYAADNPLKYVDPDGQDITIYYEAGNPYPGHTMLLAYNQNTGDSATRSFGPDHSRANTFETAVGIPVPGTDRFGYEDIKSPDDLRKNFTSYTIQTTPEEAQEVIDAIRAHPDGDYTTYWNNCTTSCSKLLRLIKQSASHALTPAAFFQDIWGQEHGGSDLLPEIRTEPSTIFLFRRRGDVEDWPWSSFRHYSTGEIGAVEIESWWTGTRRVSGLAETHISEARCGAPSSLFEEEN